MKKNATRYLALSLLVTGAITLGGCGGGSGGNSNLNPTSYSVGGAITGLGDLTGLVLANGSDTLQVPANATSFTMPTSVANGQPYDLTVKIHPTALYCSVVSGSGTVNGANVTSITVSCEAGSESVLHYFAGGATDGADPDGGLIQASDGNLYGVTYGGGANCCGALFKITPDGTETVLHYFTGGSTDGLSPVGSLIEASDGNFYGVTDEGGTSNNGVVFKITPTGTESVLYSFDGGTTDGANPVGSLIQASDGSFYGVTRLGGTSGYGVLFKITPGGTETVLHSFAGGTANDGATPIGPLIQGSDGNLYGVTYEGGASYDGVAFKSTLSGAESVLYSFHGGTTDGANPAGGLIQASDGNFYGVTQYGGPNGGAVGAGVVFKMTPDGTESVLYLFKGGTSDGAWPGGALIVGSDGNFYGTTYASGASGYGVVFKVTPDGAESVLYSFAGRTTDGANPVGGLIQASDGSLYGMTAEGGSNNQGTIFEFN